MPSAVKLQENFCERLNPFSDMSSRSSSFFVISIIFLQMSSTFRGSTNKPPSPTTAGGLNTFHVITGILHAIASSIGNPNPSCKDGLTNTSEHCNNVIRSFSGTKPKI